MNILYDTYIYKLQKTGGINRYLTEIVSNLPKKFQPFLFQKIENSLFLPSHPRIKNFWIPNALRLSPAILKWRMRSIDVVHPSYYHLCEPLTWSALPGKVVITVYDLIMMRFAERYSRSEKVIKDQKAALKRADHIICISHSTQNDLLERFPECESRSSVIPLAASLSSSKVSMERPFPNRYFLYVGGRTFYKNFILTLHAFAILRKKYQDLQLVVVGGAFNDEEKKLLAQLKLSGAVFLVEYPEDELLSLLYQHSFALLYPSEYEGFGLPPLEAMKMGVPVIALNTSSLPEVVGTGGILLEPKKATASVLAEAVISLLESETLYKQLSCEALKQAHKFSWKRTVDETIEVYKGFQ